MQQTEEDTNVDKTKVDDMLIQMIQPKLEEIEGRFSRGEGLKDEDINMLLLKSQYNHINHLDLRMDEVTADVSNLRGEFGELKGDFKALRGDFKLLEQNVNNKIASLEQNMGNKISNLDQKMDLKISGLETKISDAINKNMRWSIGLIALIVTVLKLADTFAK